MKVGWPRAALALTLAFVLVALGAWGWWNPGAFVLVDTLFNHVVLFGVLAALLAGYGLAALTHRVWLRMLVLVPALVVALLWGLIGAWVTITFGSDSEVEAQAPDHNYKAVVASVSLGIDPGWVVFIEQTGSLTAQRFEVGCISGDDPQYTFEEVSWSDDAGRLILTLDGHTVTVQVDPDTGAPEPVSDDAWNC